MKSMDLKDQHQTTTTTTAASTLLQSSTAICDDLLIPAGSTDNMEAAVRRNTEEREFEKERKRVRYVSAGCSAIFTFLFVLVFISTIGLNWWYSLVICGVPALLGGMLLLRRYIKDAKRRRLELEAEMAYANALTITAMPFSALYYEQMMQQYAVQPCTLCQHCQQSLPSNNAPTLDSTPPNAVNNASPTIFNDDNRPPAYHLLYPADGNSLPAAT